MDPFLAHAIIEPTAVRAGGDQPEASAARALSAQVLAGLGEHANMSAWRVRTREGKPAAMVVLTTSAGEAERERFATAARRVLEAGAIAGVQRVHAVSSSGDALLADLWTTGCATDLPTLGWSPRRRLEFARRAVVGLEALHAAGIVHGCLCADNVLLDDDLQPVLSEVGLVDVHRLGAARAEARGYWQFAAPEVRSGEQPRAQSDLWSAGRLLGQLVPEADLPRLAGVVRRCLAPRADLRFADATELLVALDAVLASLPAEEASGVALRGSPGRGRVLSRASIAPPVEAPRPALSRPSRWPALAGAVILAAAGAAAYVLGAPTDTAPRVFSGMSAVGAALLVWSLAPPHRGQRWWRPAAAAAVAAAVVALDPVGWSLRQGALRRLQGGDVARRAAVTEIVDLGGDFRGARLAGFDLSGLDLSRADLRGVDLARADLSGARLRGARLDGASLEGARLDHAELEDATLDAARRPEAASCDAATVLPARWRCVDGRLLRE